MGLSLTGIFNWLKPKAPPAPVVVAPPPPPILAIPNLYQAQEADILPLIQKQLQDGATLAGSQALHAVCAMGWVQSATLLIDNGADINAHADYGTSSTTPFMAAAGNANPELIAELLKRGADHKAVDKNGHDALYHYIMDRGYYVAPCTEPRDQEKDREAFKMLLDLGLTLEPVMDHFIYNGRRHLASMVPQVEEALKFEDAVKGKDYETVYNMLDGGMKPDVGATFSGEAALCIAAGQNDLKMMGMLMAAGANPNIFSKHFDALHAAAITGSRDAFVKLVGAGVKTEGDRYAYDRYEDTTIVEVAAMCKKDEGMKGFVEDVLSRKQEVIADYERTKEDFFHPYNHVSVETAQKVAVHKPLHLKRQASPSAS